MGVAPKLSARSASKYASCLVVKSYAKNRESAQATKRDHRSFKRE